VTFWLCDKPPTVPVMVRGNVPEGPFLCVLIVNVDDPLPPGVSVTGLGLNEPVVLFGRPLTLKVTLPPKPLIEFRFTV
jgi:hypothetical protein